MKTETQQFIEDAINGGYTSGNMINNNISYEDNFKRCALDPKAWQAVGKVRGWPDVSEIEAVRTGVIPVSKMSIRWLWNMHRFIDHLADGKTIEEALLAIK